MTTEITVDECTFEHVLEAVNRIGQGEPVSLNQIREALPAPIRPPHAVLQQFLDSGVREHRIFAYPPSRSQLRYSDQSLEQLARKRLLQKLAQGMATKSECLRVLNQSVFQELSRSARGQFFDALVKEGMIRKLPAVVGGRAPLYSTRPPAARDYLDDAIAKIAKKLQLSKEDVTRHFLPTGTAPSEHVTSTEQTDNDPVHEGNSFPRDTDLQDVILQAMHEINPRVTNGDLVSIPELRQRLDFHAEDKVRFDRALLNLYRDRRVVLSRISTALVKDQDRDRYVVDEDGQYYNTVAFWSQ